MSNSLKDCEELKKNQQLKEEEIQNNLEMSKRIFSETKEFSTQDYIYPWSLEDVSQNNLSNNEPSLIIEEGGEEERIIHAFWSAVPPGESREDIFYCKKNETTWEEPIHLIANQTSSDKHPKAAIDANGTIHLVWHRNWPTVDGQIWYTNSKNWSQRMPIREPPSTNDCAEHPDVIIDNYGIIHVTWEEDSYGKYQVFYASNKNDWEAKFIPNEMGHARHPVIKWCASDNTTRIAYVRELSETYPEVCWIYDDGTTTKYHPLSANIEKLDITIGYDQKEGVDYLFWLNENDNLSVARNRQDNPEIWELIGDPSEMPATDQIRNLQLHCLKENTLFISWQCYHLNQGNKFFVVSVYKNGKWGNRPLSEENYHFQFCNSQKDSNGNIHMIYERGLKTGEPPFDIYYLLVGIDDRPPTIDFINPSPYEILSGIVNVTVNVYDASGISKVEFSESSGSLTSFTDTEAPYIWSWDTSVYFSLSREITAIVWDNNGESTEKEIQIYVDNSPPTIQTLIKSPGVVYDNTTVTVFATIEDNDQIANSTLYYRFKGDTNWNETALEHFTGIQYSSKINMTTGGKFIEYYVEAKDRASNVGNSTIQEFEVLWYDSDFDGLGDNIEEQYGCDPNNPDSDGDGLEDGEEVYEYLTDPAVKDTDGDGYNDGEEITKGSNPLDPNSVPPGWFTQHSKPLIIFSIIIGVIIVIAAVIYLLMEIDVINIEKVQAKTSNVRAKWRAVWAQIWRGAKRTFGKETKRKAEVEPKTVKEPQKPLTEADIQALEPKFDEYTQQIEVLTFDFLERKLKLSEENLEDFLLAMKRKEKPIKIDLDLKKVKVIRKTGEELSKDD